MIKKPLVLSVYPAELATADYLSSNIPVKAMSVATPPTADEGDMYVVAPVGATGEFAGHENEVAVFAQGAWTFYDPRMGDLAIVRSSPPVMYFFNGTNWEPFAGLANVAKTLVTPIISSQANVPVGQDVVYTVTNVDAHAAALMWEFDGTPIVVSGALTGSLSPTITVRWPTAGVYTAKVKSISGVADYTDSAWSAPDGIKIGILETPILSVPLTAAPFEDIVMTAVNLDPNATSITWEFSGTPTFIAGSPTGSLATSITTQRGAITTHSVRAKYVGGNGWQDSAWSTYSYTTLQNKPALPAPTVTGPATVTAGDNVTFTATDVDPSATSLRWDFTGSPEIVSGSLTGSNATSITVRWAATGSNAVRVQAIGDAAHANSPWSGYKTVTATKPPLPTPVITGPVKAPVNTNMTFTVSGVYPAGTTFEWEFSGSPTVVSGQLTGGTTQSVTVKFAAVNEYAVRVRAISTDPAIDNTLWTTYKLLYAGMLQRPVLEYPATALPLQDIVTRATNIDADVASVEWWFSGDPTIVYGTRTGSTDPLMVTQRSGSGAKYVYAYYKSNNPLYADSHFATATTVL